MSMFTKSNQAFAYDTCMTVLLNKLLCEIINIESGLDFNQLLKNLEKGKPGVF